jgi:hypothetical protein
MRMARRPEILVFAEDGPGGVTIGVLPPISNRRGAYFPHDDDYAYRPDMHEIVSERHRSALRKASDYAQKLAARHGARFTTNF